MSHFASVLTREIPLADPLDALAALAPLPHAFFFHSALSDSHSRWSYFGADPFATFGPSEYEAALVLWRRGRVPRDAEAPAPFTGGLLGAWAYDFGRRLERLPAIASDDVGWPDV